MQVKIFNIPIPSGEYVNEEMNVFLRSHKIIDINSELVHISTNAYWSFYIKYIAEGKSAPFEKKEKVRIDYREVLDESSFKRFSLLRAKRKVLAELENIPAYVVSTDEQLAEIAKMDEPTLGAMKAIKGLGDITIEKYGASLLDALK